MWVKLRGFPLWPARIIEELADNLIRVKVFDKKATEVEVLHNEDTKVFCRVEDLQKKKKIFQPSTSQPGARLTRSALIFLLKYL